MTQWTPGPWVVRNDHRIFSLGRTEFNRTTNSEVPEFIAGCNGLAGSANARLIAAAPEMAEILTRLVDQWDQVSGAPHRTIDQARALLARLDA